MLDDLIWLIKWEENHRMQSRIYPGTAERISMRGAWPVAAKNLSKPSREMVVVAVFTKG
jgi:hypothetical protein